MGYHGIPTLRDSCGRGPVQWHIYPCVWWNLQCFKVRDLEGSPHDHYISRLGVRLLNSHICKNHSCLKKTPQMWKFTDLKSRMRKEKKNSLCQVLLFLIQSLYRLLIIVVFTFSFLRDSVLNMNDTCAIFLNSFNSELFYSLISTPAILHVVCLHPPPPYN